MAKKRFHGSPERFEIVADFIENYYGSSVHNIADVAGGQGMLSRLLNKRGYNSEVIDPRGYTMVGISSRPEEYKSSMADYYDLIIGLHPDQALKDVVESSMIRSVFVIPCCNFWDKTKKLGREALSKEIDHYFRANSVNFEKISLDFKGPQNIGFATKP